MKDNHAIRFPVLKTERLTLRQLISSDEEEIFALRSDEDVNKYLERQPGKSLEDARGFSRTIHENIQGNDSFYWAIALNSSDKLMGTICLFGISEDHSKAEIGYELLPTFQGQGIMKEAAKRVIRFAFQDISLNTIEAYTHCENERSIRLLEQLNFRMDSAADKNFRIYKLTHHTWKKKHPLN